MKKRKETKKLELQGISIIIEMRKRCLSYREIEDASGHSKSHVQAVLSKHRHPSRRVWKSFSLHEQSVYIEGRIKAQKAQRKFERRGHIKDPEIRDHIASKLINNHFSPEIISATMAKEIGKRVCCKTIYTFIKKERKELTKYLTERGKPRRQRVMDRRGRFKQAAPSKRSHADRPVAANERSEIGHWEGDTVVSNKSGQGGLLSLRERRTREQIFVILPDLKSETVKSRIWAVLEKLPPEKRKTITLDNGPEFSFTTLITLEAKYDGLLFYYCDPYKSYQKGTVENGHRILRWYFPKGTDFSKVPPAEIEKVQNIINNRPMKCLSFLSPNEFLADKQGADSLKVA
jgi:IS30 family transposase